MLTIDPFEYPLFGKGLTRFIIPGGDWPRTPDVANGHRSQYLLYQTGAMVTVASCDIALGGDFWLRDQESCAEAAPRDVLFRADLRSKQWAVSGWSAPESWGVWSDGGVASVALKTNVDFEALRRDPRLVVEARGFAIAGQPQLVDVVVNDHLVARWSFALGQGVVHKEAAIPLAALAGYRSTLNISFRIAHPVSVPNDRDGRKLGIGVRSIEIATDDEG